MLSHFSRVQLFTTARFLCPWYSPGKGTGVGCYALLQGIFPTQGLNLVPYISCIGRWALYTVTTWEASDRSILG